MSTENNSAIVILMRKDAENINNFVHDFIHFADLNDMNALDLVSKAKEIAELLRKEL